MNHTSSFSFYKLSQWLNINKPVWARLSCNPSAIQLLEQNPDKIDWYMLPYNENRFHPKHMNKWVSWGQEDEDDFDFI